jgi:hypothetical protein
MINDQPESDDPWEQNALCQDISPRELIVSAIVSLLLAALINLVFLWRR